MLEGNIKYIKEKIAQKKIKLNILIIDEKEKTFDNFKIILESRGHKIKIITEIIKCVNEILTNNYDIIIFDYNVSKIADVLISDILRNVLNYNGLIFAHTNKENKDKDIESVYIDGVIIKTEDNININKILNFFERIQKIDNEYILNKNNIDKSLILF